MSHSTAARQIRQPQGSDGQVPVSPERIQRRRKKIQKLIDNQRLTIFTAGGRVGRAHRHQGQQNDDAASSAVHRAHLRVFHLCVPNQEQRQSLIIDALSICQEIFSKKKTFVSEKRTRVTQSVSIFHSQSLTLCTKISSSKDPDQIRLKPAQHIPSGAESKASGWTPIHLPKLKPFAHSITLNSVHQQHPRGSAYPIDQHTSIDQNATAYVPVRRLFPAAHFRAAGTVSLIKASNNSPRRTYKKKIQIFQNCRHFFPLKANNRFHHMWTREPPGGNQKQIPALVQIF